MRNIHVEIKLNIPIYNQQTIIIREQEVSRLEKKLIEGGFTRLGEFSIGTELRVRDCFIDRSLVGKLLSSRLRERVQPIVYTEKFIRESSPSLNTRYLVYIKDEYSDLL